MAKIQDSIGNQTPDNFKLAVALGQVDGWRTLRKFGQNDDIDGGPEDAWPPGTIRVLPSAAAQVSVVSDSANDTAAGTGCRAVTLQGLDANKLEITETVALNGTSTVTSTASFLRLNSAFCATAGSGKVNDGDISMSIGGDLQAFIQADEGQTHQTLYTVPSDHWFLVDLYTITAGRLGTDTLETLGQIRTDGINADSAWRSISDIYMAEIAYQNSSSATLVPPGTEMRVQFVTSGNNRRASAVFGGYLISSEWVAANS